MFLPVNIAEKTRAAVPQQSFDGMVARDVLHRRPGIDGGIALKRTKPSGKKGRLNPAELEPGCPAQQHVGLRELKCK
jgi:hypothetical protein